MQVRSEEERQSGSSSGCVGRLRVHRTACSSDLSCRKSRWPSLGRLLCARFISIEHDAFFSFYRPQMGARIKNGLGGLLPPVATGHRARVFISWPGAQNHVQLVAACAIAVYFGAILGPFSLFSKSPSPHVRRFGLGVPRNEKLASV